MKTSDGYLKTGGSDTTTTGPKFHHAHTNHTHNTHNTRTPWKTSCTSH